MTKEQINAVLENVRSWPQEDQEELVELAREIQARRTGMYVLNDEERAVVREGLEQAMRGEFVPGDEMDAFLEKIRRPMRIRYTPRAREDIDQIWHYLNERSPSGAANVLKTIYAGVQFIGENPESSQPTDERSIRVKV